MCTEIEINQFNLNSGVLSKYREALYDNIHWHKVIVENAEDLDKLTVLSTIMNFCYPLDFIPIKYQSFKKGVHFLLKNCGNSLERICSYNLSIPNPQHKDKPFIISIQPCFATVDNLKVNIKDNIMSILKKRLKADTGALNLDNFTRDPDLQEYFPLSQPKLLFYILFLSRDLRYKSLNLSNNNIEVLKPLEALNGLEGLTAIDLSNNRLKEMKEITSLKCLGVKELWLDGNPLCDDYDEFTYGKVSREYLDGLEKLDGVNIQGKHSLLSKRNFLCDESGYDLVDQFLEHYFTLYDARDRSILNDLYHKEAMFSLTANYIPSQSTSSTTRLITYKKMSRNLLQTADFSKNFQYLFTGNQEIVEVLKTFPQTEHDPFSFTVDLISHTEKMAVLVVSGVFREVSPDIKQGKVLLGFTRTFVLLAGDDQEYSIINEMLCLSNATTDQAAMAFRQVKVPRLNHIRIPQPQDTLELIQVAQVLRVLSGMNLEWSRRVLEDCDCNLEKALAFFVDSHKRDRIPKRAFDCSPCDDGKSNDIKTSLHHPPDGSKNYNETNNRISVNHPVPKNTIQKPINKISTLSPIPPIASVNPPRTVPVVECPPNKNPVNPPLLNVKPTDAIPTKLPLNSPILTAITNATSISSVHPVSPPIAPVKPPLLDSQPQPIVANKTLMRPRMRTTVRRKEKTARPALINIQLRN